MLCNEGERLRRVVVCTPREEYFRVSDPGAHNFNEVADPERTREQHDSLKRALAESGCEVIDVPELPGHPNSVFTRDVSLATPEGFVKLRMGLETRRGEEEWMAGHLRALGEPCAGEIEPPGTVEGGDVILAGDVAFVGRSRRTNESGVRQLSALLERMGYEVRVAPVPEDCLHLGGVLSAIGPRWMLGCRGALPEDLLRGFAIVEVPRRGPSTGNMICLDDNRLIANPAENAEAIEIVRRHRVEVKEVDLSEFRKGAGGPTCLILPVTRVSAGA